VWTYALLHFFVRTLSFAVLFARVGVRLLYRNVCVAVRFKKVKWSRFKSGVAQCVGKGIALLFHDRGTRRGWVVSSSTPLPAPYPWERPGTHFTGRWVGPKAGLDGRKISSIPDRPARSQSLYRLSYSAHYCKVYLNKILHSWSILVMHWHAVVCLSEGGKRSNFSESSTERCLWTSWSLSFVKNLRLAVQVLLDLRTGYFVNSLVVSGK